MCSKWPTARLPTRLIVMQRKVVSVLVGDITGSTAQISPASRGPARSPVTTRRGPARNAHQFAGNPGEFAGNGVPAGWMT